MGQGIQKWKKCDDPTSDSWTILSDYMHVNSGLPAGP